MKYSDLKPEDTLMPRQFETVRLLARGMSYSEIAQEMGLACETVHRHLYLARQKVGASNATGLAVWFVRRYPTEKDERAGYRRALEVREMQFSNNYVLAAAKRNLRLGK